ncbi:hypothetical protein ACFSTH_00875 [Paenibacillus yanchengensis]|uniref:Uncharacterized protein n=1 Tax=Paenibacillus yanchengensis TaxID=2035833 RepID=A0ABW4YF53_9BACL
MRITIEGDSQMYIYLKDAKIHQITHNTLTDVLCYLLFDVANNFIGIRICNRNANTGQELVLPMVGEIEYPLHQASITDSHTEIVIKFDRNAQIHEEAKDKCLIDLCDAGIFGIEPMPYTRVRGTEVIKPFIDQTK